MIKKHFLLLALIWLSYGCKKADSTEVGIIDRTEKESLNDGIREDTKKADTTFIKSKEQIVGIWESRNKEWETINITESEYQDKGHGTNHKYEFNGDSIFIKFLEYTVSGKPYIINDSLIISTQNGLLKYIRKK